MERKFTDKSILLAGAITGIAAVLLSFLGNPANMGFCIACFLRDMAGGLGFHQADKVSYVRPEIIGLILGAFIVAMVKKEFRARAGSSPITRFILGNIVMIGALVFLGCSLRMMLRIAGGDLNALVGLAGFIAGIYIGVIFIKKGFSLKRSYDVSSTDGFALPSIMLFILILLLAVPMVFRFSTEGPGSKHAPLIASLLIALAVGAFAQRSRFCMIGGIRDFILFRDTRLLSGFVILIIVVFLGNIGMSKFNLGFAMQPIAHSDHIWNFFGMLIFGWGAVLLGGCPFRQLVLAGEGNADSALTILGMISGAAIAHNFKLAASPDKLDEAKQLVVGGISNNGKAAVFLCIVALLAISIINLPKEEI